MRKNQFIIVLSLCLSTWIWGQNLMIGMRHTEQSPSFADTLGEFFLRDHQAMIQFLEAIDTTKTQMSNRCGIHYDIWMKTAQDTLGERLRVSLACGTIVWRGKTFSFDVNSLRPFLDISKTPKVRVLDFPNMQTARKGFREMLADQRLLYVEAPEWNQFDGMADYTFSCEGRAFDCLEMRAKIVAHVKEKITRGALDVPLDIRIAGGTRTQVRLEIHTTESVGKDLPYRLGESGVVWAPYKRFYVKTWWE